MVKEQTEAQIIRDCKFKLDLLKCHNILEYKTISVPYGNRPSDTIKSQQMAGLADMLIFLSGGRTIHVEFKSTVGKQRATQIEWQQDLEKLGHSYFLIRSVKELIDMLLKFGIDINQYRWV